MKGLLLKDIKNLQQQGKIYLIIIFIWAAIGLVDGDVAFFSGMMCLLAALLPISALAYDERAKWDKYGLTMPVSKTQFVLSKYLLGIGSGIIGFILSIVFQIIVRKLNADNVLASAGVLGIALIMIGVLLPCMFRFGVEKGRLVMLIFCLIPISLPVLAKQVGWSAPSESFWMNMQYWFPIVVLCVLIVSVLISIYIYRHKEF